MSRPEWLYGENGALAQRDADIAAATVEANAAFQAILDSASDGFARRAALTDRLRTAIYRLRELNGGTAIDLDALGPIR